VSRTEDGRGAATIGRAWRVASERGAVVEAAAQAGLSMTQKSLRAAEERGREMGGGREGGDARKAHRELCRKQPTTTPNQTPRR